jgi:hypothetical protein
MMVRSHGLMIAVFLISCLSVLPGCVERPNFAFDNLFDPLSDKYSKALTGTNFGFYFAAGALDGFAAASYSAADAAPNGDGGIQNIDGEHLFIWATNAKRSRGAGWFWGGWERRYPGTTNLYGSPPAGHRWLMAIKIRSSNSSILDNLRQVNFLIMATNLAGHEKGGLEYVSPSAVSVSDSVIYLEASDLFLTYTSTMTTAREVLEHANIIRFALDNGQYLDGDSFGFIVDYVIFGYW